MKREKEEHRPVMTSESDDEAERIILIGTASNE
jgi:hypothetical protein